MTDIKLKLNENGRGGFFAFDGGEEIGEMEVSVNGTSMIVYHTEVVPKQEGKGVAKQMLATMVDYARKNGLKVTPLCPYVHAQFKRHPDEYADIWNKIEEE
jgi:predicted GNAT family acetyltransferase